MDDALRLTLIAPAETRAGARVPFTLRVENTSARPLELALRGREIAFDVIVSTTDGAIVWRRLDGAVIPGILQLRVLGPGEHLDLRASWESATPGSYFARGALLTDEPSPRETPLVRVRVLPPAY